MEFVIAGVRDEIWYYCSCVCNTSLLTAFKLLLLLLLLLLLFEELKI